MNKKYLSLVIAVFITFFSVNAYSKFYIVDEVKKWQQSSIQKTPVWCWAASIQLVLNTHGVHWTQEDVVRATKGYIKFDTAQVSEISWFLNNWGFDYDGQSWNSSSQHYNGVLPAKRLISEIDNGRPVIVTYKTGGSLEHAVVVYGVLKPEGKGIHSIYYFDPYTGKINAVTGKEFKYGVTNSWTIRISK